MFSTLTATFEIFESDQEGWCLHCRNFGVTHTVLVQRFDVPDEVHEMCDDCLWAAKHR